MIPAMGAILYFLWMLSYVASGIYGGDSGDLVSAAATFGVPHPPGYPLYTFLGWLATQFPIGTIAWRVALISTFAHAVTICIIWNLVFRITRSHYASLASALFLTGNYVFFLYSVTPEVFALLDLFVAFFLYVVVRTFAQPTRRLFIFFLFSFGLALTHHHLILFLVPAFVYGFWTNRARIFSLIGSQRTFFRDAIVAFVLGLTPYLYVPFAAARGALINWNYVTNMNQFVKLVTRADYGTFVSGGFFGEQIVQRISGVKAYGQLLFVDFGFTLLVALFGLFMLIRYRPRVGWFLCLALLFIGPIFFFYASFPLVNRFTIGTFERFLLPSVVIIAVLYGHATQVITRLLRRVPMLAAIAWSLLLLYPVNQMRSMDLRFTGLSQDKTADNYGKDILSSVPSDGILLLSKDTPLFITQYVRYALRFRSDIVLLHASRLQTASYRALITRVYPKLHIPPGDESAIADFISLNAPQQAITSNTRLDIPQDFVWVPRGLVYLLTSREDLPSVSDVQVENDRLWASYRDPTQGILGRYNHLMLSDIRDGYAEWRLTYGKLLLRAGLLADSKFQFDEGIRLDGDVTTPDGYLYKGLAHLFDSECQDALSAFDLSRKSGLSDSAELYYYEAITYRDCVGDLEASKRALEKYEQMADESETPLEPIRQ